MPESKGSPGIPAQTVIQRDRTCSFIRDENPPDPSEDFESDKAGGVTAIRVTCDGMRLLRDQPLLPTASATHVQPNFQIFAFEPTDESVLFALDRLADRVRAEQAVERLLSRDSV